VFVKVMLKWKSVQFFDSQCTVPGQWSKICEKNIRRKKRRQQVWDTAGRRWWQRHKTAGWFVSMLYWTDTA